MSGVEAATPDVAFLVIFREFLRATDHHGHLCSMYRKYIRIDIFIHMAICFQQGKYVLEPSYTLFLPANIIPARVPRCLNLEGHGSLIRE